MRRLRAGRRAIASLGLCLGCHSGPATGPELGVPTSSSIREEGRSVAQASADDEPASREPVRAALAHDHAFPLDTWAPAGLAPRPLIIAAHGAGCHAEDHCAYYWRLARGRAIVACLRGDPLVRSRPEEGFYFRDHHALARELEAAVAALRRHFGARLGQNWTFAGYSQGATMGALLLPESPLAFTQILLIEGGGEGMPQLSAQRLRDKGTERVLFVCGSTGCASRAERVASLLTTVGIDARVGVGEGAGHTYLGAVETTVLEQATWLWPGELVGK